MRVQQKFPGLAHFLLVLRSDGDEQIEARKREFRAKAVELGIPVFDEIGNAGQALKALRAHERFLQSRRG
jgi:chemotaxis receptor (MCP) glutamine deamidase CheD